jgi:hypothetical protein
VQFIANTPAHVQLGITDKVATFFVNISSYSAVTSVVFSAPISNLAAINRTHVAITICKN